MEKIKAVELINGFYQFGNKGSVWSDETHIAKSGDSLTLCGTPMLSSNWARIWEHKEIGCKQCLKVYSPVKYRFLRPALWFCKNDEVEVDEIKQYYTEKCINELINYGYIEVINE